MRLVNSDKYCFVSDKANKTTVNLNDCEQISFVMLVNQLKVIAKMLNLLKV